MTICENPKEQDRKLLASTNEIPRLELINKWASIVRRFSVLSLTFDKDKLPALSGIAKRLLAQRPGDEYLAGLWRSTLVRNLCWTPSRKLANVERMRSPSWSWIAVKGAHEVWMSESDRCIELEGGGEYSEVLDAAVTLAGPDPTGDVIDGMVRLRGPLVWAEIKREQLMGVGLEVKWHPDFNVWGTGMLVSGDRLACLRLAQEQYSEFCLVLQPIREAAVDGHDVTLKFRRLGHIKIGTRKASEFGFTAELQPTEVTII
jgi:hypothetical protein